MIKPAYSVSFLLSINTVVWQNVLYFPNYPRIMLVSNIIMFRPHVTFPIFLSDFIQILILSIGMIKVSDIKFHENPCSGDRKTDANGEADGNFFLLE